MNWELWGPVFTCAALALPPIIQALAKKALARINNIPDDKTRREATAAEHALEMERLTEIQGKLDEMASALQVAVVENAALRAQSAAREKKIAALEKQLLAALTLKGEEKQAKPKGEKS